MTELNAMPGIEFETGDQLQNWMNFAPGLHRVSAYWLFEKGFRSTLHLALMPQEVTTWNGCAGFFPADVSLIRAAAGTAVYSEHIGCCLASCSRHLLCPRIAGAIAICLHCMEISL